MMQSEVPKKRHRNCCAEDVKTASHARRCRLPYNAPATVAISIWTNNAFSDASTFWTEENGQLATRSQTELNKGDESFFAWGFGLYFSHAEETSFHRYKSDAPRAPSLPALAAAARLCLSWRIVFLSYLLKLSFPKRLSRPRDIAVIMTSIGHEGHGIIGRFSEIPLARYQSASVYTSTQRNPYKGWPLLINVSW